MTELLYHTKNLYFIPKVMGDIRRLKGHDMIDFLFWKNSISGNVKDVIRGKIEAREKF